MVKYATQIPRESIVDVEGLVNLPNAPIESCSQRDVELACTGIRAISRSGLLPFEITDAARSEEEVRAAAEKGACSSSLVAIVLERGHYHLARLFSFAY